MKKVATSILLGVIEGVLFYYVFAAIIPWFITEVARVPLPFRDVVNPIRLSLYLGVFISLGILSSLVKAPIGIVFDVLTSILALSLLLTYTGFGVVRELVELAGISVEAEFNIRVLIAIITGFTVVTTIIRIFEKITSIEKLD